jgi:hypothetical protein
MGEHGSGFKVGDRVETPSGITGTVVEAPKYYELAKGATFTGWGLVVEEDTDPGLTLTRIERGLSPGSLHLVRRDLVTRIDD